ncbi:endoplasmic reticulum protein ERp29, C-terminal domain-domain-containing protein [Phakopsora pachyrhizi]|uniref:protein disulfide-isomerase n=1 Tax=Phakopsora pachyrhizi TaxID=170000 RepID=A0AAV0AGG2_PHAPC|nr:endoplasmic reticulum protein ERp29, C-terminal domain-domain-containing protein [Phakopsora pachyrhizi]
MWLRGGLIGLMTYSLTINSVLCGLEHSKHSTKLDNNNFDEQIALPEVGTLTAFFAPWCGREPLPIFFQTLTFEFLILSICVYTNYCFTQSDCKSLLGTWDIVAETFKTDSKCRVAHLDADQSSNRDLASRFSVSGFPTIKFIYKNTTKDPLDYQESRAPEAFIKFLNRECGTYRASGGLLLPEAGRVASLDELIGTFFGVSSDRPSLITKANELASVANVTSAAYYVKVMNKLVADESWLAKEIERLQKLAAKGATMASDKFEELQIKQNILKAFNTAKETIKGGAEATKEKVERITGEL